MTPVERVHRLVQAGTVAPEEGERLLSAMTREAVGSPAWILVNPFDRFGGGVAAAIGAVVGALSVWVTRLGIRFDGFLDLHFAHARVAPVRVSLIEQLAGWVLPALLFWAYARAVARHSCVAWNITLLYQGFKNASGLRGPTLVGGLSAMVVVAEVASKIVLALAS
jgi:hypothetical protein